MKSERYKRVLIKMSVEKVTTGPKKKRPITKLKILSAVGENLQVKSSFVSFFRLHQVDFG